MLVEQIWTANAYRNFNYLIVCPDTGEAMAVDPLDSKKCLAAADNNGWTITQILNTHEHGDHTGGNRAMIAATGAKLLAHAKAAARRHWESLVVSRSLYDPSHATRDLEVEQPKACAVASPSQPRSSHRKIDRGCTGIGNQQI